MKVYPRLSRTLYAVYVEGHPRALQKGLFWRKEDAMAHKRKLLHDHRVSLRGGQILRVVVVAYDMRRTNSRRPTSW